MKDLIEFVEGEQILVTFTAVRDGTAVNITGATITLNMVDDGATSNRITNGACTITSAAAGVFVFTFTTAHLTFSGSDTDAKGTITVKIVLSGITEKKKYRYVIVRDQTV